MFEIVICLAVIALGVVNYCICSDLEKVKGNLENLKKEIEKQ